LALLSFVGVFGAVAAGLTGAPSQNVIAVAAVAGSIGVLSLFADGEARGWE